MVAFSILISGYKATAIDTLSMCLDLMPPESGSAEVLFLDNTPDSRHAGCVAEICESFPDKVLIYLPVPVPGKAAAQNIAIRRSSGKYVVCLDDDVLPDPDLLREYELAFGLSPCAAVQGRVELLFEGEPVPPAWLDARLRLDLAEMDFGEVIYPFEKGLTGANMAFRREVFERYGLFDERLGPGRAGTLEDQEFSERIRVAGESQLFWPGASVKHRIPPSRLKVNSFARIHYDVGYSDYLLSRNLVKGGGLRVGAYIVRQMMRQCGKMILFGLLGRRAQAVLAYAEIFHNLGYYRQFMSYQCIGRKD